MDKVFVASAAVADMPDGASVAVAGFGVAHRFPSTLIKAVSERGVRDLCVVANSLGSGDQSPEVWIHEGRVGRLIVSFSSRAGMRSVAEEKIAAGEIELEIVPQGVLVDRLRAAGAGLAAFYSPVTVGTPLAAHKELRTFNEREYVLETALPVDYALLRGYRADRAGNVQFRGGTQNFNPSFAKAARVAIVEVDEIVDVGVIPPESVDLPGIFVSGVVRSTVKVVVDMSTRGRRPALSNREYLGKPALSRMQMAGCAAKLIPDGSYVNLGSGLPNLVASHLEGHDVWLHAENGVLGYGPRTSAREEIDLDLFDAGGGFVRPRDGMSFFDSVTSFEIARSGRLSTVVLGGYQVDASGGLANWSNPAQVGGGIGGAMDLLAGGSDVIVLMEHCDSQGRPKMVDTCTYPLTGVNCVSLVVTDLAIFRYVDSEFVMEQVAPGFTPAEVADLTDMKVRVSDSVGVMT